MSSATLTSILIGLLFGALNYWFLMKIVAGMVRSDEVSHWKTTLFFLGKMLLLLLIIGLILAGRYVTPLPLLAGYSVSLIVGIMISVVKGKRKG